MKVILLQELRGKGGEGDVVEVATGYAVNYLFPKKIAIEANKGNLKQLELRRHNIAKREETRLDSAGKMLNSLEGKVVKIAAKVGEEGQLFGSVTTTQISEALLGAYGIEVDRRSIDLKGPIKTVGEHDAVVSIYREVKATIQIMVVDENAPDEEPVDEAEADDEAGAEVEDGAEVEAEDADAEVEAAADAEVEAVSDDAEALAEVEDDAEPAEGPKPEEEA